MPLFRRKTRTDTSSASEVGGVPSEAGANPNRWDIDAISAEWPQASPSDDDLLAWRNGNRMYEEGQPPVHVVNLAEYMSREVRHALYGATRLSRVDTAESLRRMLELLARTPTDPPFWTEFAHRLVRLVFAIVRLNGWQPAELGGDGTVSFTAVDGNPELFDAAMRDTGTPHGEAISRFFTLES
jgi:hypothetical protein